MGAWGTDVAGKKRYKLQLAMARRSLLLEVLLFECMVLWQENNAGEVSLRCFLKSDALKGKVIDVDHAFDKF